MDEVRPDDLSVSFLKEFMSLPTSYYTPGSPIKYRKWKTPNRKKKKGQVGQRKRNELRYHPPNNPLPADFYLKGNK